MHAKDGSLDAEMFLHIQKESHSFGKLEKKAWVESITIKMNFY